MGFFYSDFQEVRSGALAIRLLRLRFLRCRGSSQVEAENLPAAMLPNGASLRACCSAAQNPLNAPHSGAILENSHYLERFGVCLHFLFAVCVPDETS